MKPGAFHKPHVERLNAHFGNYKVRQVSQEMVEKYSTELISQGKLSPTTVNRCLTVLSSIFRKGQQWSYVGKNPCQFVKKPKPARPDMDYLTPQEIAKLIKSTDPHYRTLVTTACLTGMRISEILGLRWADVDFNSGKLYVRQTLQNKQVCQPKNDTSKRAVAIPQSLVKELKAHQLKQMTTLESNPYDLVFLNKRKFPIDTRTTNRRILHPACRAGDIRQVGFHSLRHSYVSLLLHNKESIKFVQQQVGHASAKITLDVYSHMLPGAEKEAMQRLEHSFEQAAEENILR